MSWSLMWPGARSDLQWGQLYEQSRAEDLSLTIYEAKKKYTCVYGYPTESELFLAKMPSQNFF